MTGIVSGMPMAVYHSSAACIDPSISSTGLRKITAQSPAHYWATSYLTRKAEVDEESKAMA
jgi:hypothetical protein